MYYYVSKTGNDKNCGSKDRPFLTISQAARIAEEGDHIIVREGVYRECVVPQNGARTEYGRIVYEAYEGEKVIIKGSEQITEWQKTEEGLWKAVISNDLFGTYNPYLQVIDGDWLMSPLDNFQHTGQVYMDGRALSEASALEAVSDFMWYAQVGDEDTVIYADFGDKNPKECLTEINVRLSCFCPDKTGVNYITVRGFEFAHAATKWSPPTAEQTGMLSVNWSKGWIIENNILHDARCSAICVGKEISTGDNLYNRYHRKPGYQTQLESVFAGRRVGWSKETIGSHIIRNNVIYDCGQNGIVGHMGGAFSEIYHNHIYNIGNRHEFFGYEIAGIKLHAAIDTYIHHNRIHNCWMGTWLDWEAQGTRMSGNLYYDNETDVWIEVTHGPHLVDNNIFGSEISLRNAAQGGAYIHNLFCGSINTYDTLNRSTPYHLNHSTDFMGTAVVYGGDDRFYNNVFAGNPDAHEGIMFGTEYYKGYPCSMEEYIERVLENGKGDIETFTAVPQPVYINHNVYLNGAGHYDREKDYSASDQKCEINIAEQDGNVVMEITIPEDIVIKSCEIINTHRLPVPRLSEAPFESYDGKPVILDMDFFGNKRNDITAAGPLECLEIGRQMITLSL